MCCLRVIALQLVMCTLAISSSVITASSNSTANHKCSLLGVWDGGKCHYDTGWAGTTCSKADLKPLDTKLGYHNASAASWGGRPIQVPKTGVWSLFVSQFSNMCPLALWTNNSQVVRAESVSLGCANPALAGQLERNANPALPHYHGNLGIWPTP